MRKPEFPGITAERLRAALYACERVVRASLAADGGLELAALRRAVQGAHGSEHELLTLSHCMATLEGRFGAQLDKAEVASLLAALVKARSVSDGFDADGDGRVSRAESDAVRRSDHQGFAFELARDALLAATDGFDAELREWRASLTKVAAEVGERRALERRIVTAARHHAQSAQAAEALMWRLRDHATQGLAVDPERELEAAETSLLARLPVFGAAQRRGQGHLDDGEVRALLGAGDLTDFATRTAAAIAARVGGDYFERWVAGADLDGSEHLDDPEV